MDDQATSDPKRSFISILTFFICCWYLILCGSHYFQQRPLWLDEQWVFHSVVTYQLKDFFITRLADSQTFPKIYLSVIHEFSRFFDFDLLALRFFSFISMIAAFFMWLRIARYEIREPWQYLTFVLSWAASVPLIYYSAELKQYSMDVLAAGIFIWFLINQRTLAQNRRKYLVLLALLPLLGLFSYPAFLFFILPFYNLLMEKKKDRDSLVTYCFSVIFAILFVYLFDIRLAKSNVQNLGFSDYSISFQSVSEFFKSWSEGTLNLFTRWLAERPRVVKKIALSFFMFGLFYMPYGFLKNIRKNKDHLASIDSIALILYVELFILGCLGRYPFSVPRTSLFFCPLVLIMTIRGIYALKNLNRYLYGLIHSLYLIFLVFVTVGIARIMFFYDFDFSPKIF